MHGMCWNVYRIVIQDQAGGGGGGVVSKVRGARPPQGPSPGSASVYMQLIDSELNG